MVLQFGTKHLLIMTTPYIPETQGLTKSTKLWGHGDTGRWISNFLIFMKLLERLVANFLRIFSLFPTRTGSLALIITYPGDREREKSVSLELSGWEAQRILCCN